MRHVQRKKEDWQPTKLERKVQDIARRRASRQLLRVSSNRFQKAQQKYLEWEAFSLWVRSVIVAEGHPPSWMLETLQKRCPGFLQHKDRYRKTRQRQSDPVPLRLLEWIHNHIFSDAKRESWLDALIFHAVRDPRSQRTWAYWQQCEDDWKKKRPRFYPSFEEWSRAVEKWEMPG